MEKIPTHVSGFSEGRKMALMFLERFPMFFDVCDHLLKAHEVFPNAMLNAPLRNRHTRPQLAR